MQDVKAIPDNATVWLLVPTKPDWTQFDFRKLGPRYSKSFIGKLKRSRYHSKASDYALSEPVNADKKSLQGLFVVVSEGKIWGFRKKATMIKKNALGIVQISQFDPKKNLIQWKSLRSKIGVGGILLDQEVRKLDDLLSGKQ